MLRLLSRLNSRLFRRRLFRLFQLKLLGPLFVFVLRLAFLLLVVVLIFAALWFRRFTLGFLALGVFPCILVLALKGLGRVFACILVLFLRGLHFRLRRSLRLALTLGFALWLPFGSILACGSLQHGQVFLFFVLRHLAWTSMSKGLLMRFRSSLQSCSFGLASVRHAAKESKLGKLL